MPKLPNDQPHQPPKQSHIEDRTEQIEATSGEDYCWRTGRLQSRKKHHRADLQFKNPLWEIFPVAARSLPCLHEQGILPQSTDYTATVRWSSHNQLVIPPPYRGLGYNQLTDYPATRQWVWPQSTDYSASIQGVWSQSADWLFCHNKVVLATIIWLIILPLDRGYGHDQLIILLLCRGSGHNQLWLFCY